jgi:hypothetical protein
MRGVSCLLFILKSLERGVVTYLVHICLIAALIWPCVMPRGAQEQVAAQPDGWRGLVIDLSTPEDAIRILGQPSSDKRNQNLTLMMIDKWLAGGKYKQKIFRTLTFKKPTGFNEARLSFLEDSLVMIVLEPQTGDTPNWFDPDDLAVAFGTKFTYQEWHIGKKLPPLTEFLQSVGDVPPKEFSEIYDMIAVSQRSLILARVNNIKARDVGPGCYQCSEEENRKNKRRDASGTFPGQVWHIEIVSRKLGHSEGSDVRQ